MKREDYSAIIRVTVWMICKGRKWRKYFLCLYLKNMDSWIFSFMQQYGIYCQGQWWKEILILYIHTVHSLIFAVICFYEYIQSKLYINNVYLNNSEGCLRICFLSYFHGVLHVYCITQNQVIKFSIVVIVKHTKKCSSITLTHYPCLKSPLIDPNT